MSKALSRQDSSPNGSSPALARIARITARSTTGSHESVGRQLPALCLRKQSAFGDADQSIMRLVILRSRKIRFVGGDQWD